MQFESFLKIALFELQPYSIYCATITVYDLSIIDSKASTRPNNGTVMAFALRHTLLLILSRLERTLLTYRSSYSTLIDIAQTKWKESWSQNSASMSSKVALSRPDRRLVCKSHSIDGYKPVMQSYKRTCSTFATIWDRSDHKLLCRNVSSITLALGTWLGLYMLLGEIVLFVHHVLHCYKHEI